VLRALSEAVGRRLPFDSFAELRAQLFKAHPHLAEDDAVAMAPPEALAPLRASKDKLGTGHFVYAVKDFYLTNPIARSSAVMAECSALAANRLAEAAE
jgi:NADH-quinone oxidoreductase subunit G